MLDILNILSGIISANFLFQPMVFSNPLSASCGLFKVALYRSSAVCHQVGSITIGGLCFAGGEEVACSALDLGDKTLQLVPWLRATHQIFYSLVFLSSVAVILFHHNAKKGWPTQRELRGYRAAIIGLHVLCNVAGLIAIMVSFGMMVIPALDMQSSTITNIQAGWAQLFTIAMLIGNVFLTIGFTNESRKIIGEYEGTLVLDKEAEVDPEAEDKPLLEKRDCAPVLEGHLVEV